MTIDDIDFREVFDSSGVIFAFQTSHFFVEKNKNTGFYVVSTSPYWIKWYMTNKRSSSGIDPWLVHVLVYYVAQINNYLVQWLIYMLQFNIRDTILTVRDIALLFTLSMNFCAGNLAFYTVSMKNLGIFFHIIHDFFR